MLLVRPFGKSYTYLMRRQEKKPLSKPFCWIKAAGLSKATFAVHMGQPLYMASSKYRLIWRQVGINWYFQILTQNQD